jgi:hypothetical protein
LSFSGSGRYDDRVAGLCLLLSAPTLGLTAHWMKGTTSNSGVIYDFETMGLYDFEVMGLIICGISWLVFPVM